MRDTRWLGLFLGIVALGIGMSQAGAQEYGAPPEDEYGTAPADQYETPPPPPQPVVVQPPAAQPQPAYVAPPAQPQQRQGRRLISPFGALVTVGGGVMDTSGDTISDLTDVGGEWEVRLQFGTQLPIAIEAAYVGTAQDINAIGLDSSAVLMSNSGELNARLNLGPILPDRYRNYGNWHWSPFAFAGAAYQRWSVVNDDFNTSNVADDDNVFAIPWGGGLVIGYKTFNVDTRFTWRSAFDEDLIRTPTGDSADASLDSWLVSAALGLEF